MKISRRLLGLSLSLWLAATLSATTHPSPFTPKELAQGYSDTAVIAKPRALFRFSADDAERREGLTLRRKFSRLGELRVLGVPTGESADSAIKRLRATGRYEYVERDVLRHSRVLAGDPSFSDQWSLRNTGQLGGTIGADISATSGWDITTDAPNVIVAVIDTGIRLTHSDLAANLWSSPAGFHGINALLSTTNSGYNNPDDPSTSGHGTHVAGVIGAVGNNGNGIAGIAWRTKLMALRFLPPEGSGSVSDSIECINFAVANGAQIINASYGDSAYSQSEFDAIKAARDAGIIFVVAAGNDSLNNDTVLDYPSGYALDNIVAVAGTNRNDVLDTSYSNYGPGSVELGAPGTDIYSTLNKNDSSYGILTGTSMAAPHVCGVLALLRAKYPSDTYRQTINRLLRGTTRLASLRGKVQTGGRLNLSQALTAAATPFNDSFAERATVSGPNVQIRSNNVGATTDAGEPSHAGVAASHSLWWTWTAPENSQVGFDTKGSAYDTVLAVYTGSSVSGLQLVGSNDDASGTTTSRVLVNVTAGTTYQIAVAGKGTASGYTALHIGAVPGNDDFANAKPVTGIALSVTATLLNASGEAGEPNPTAAAAGHSVWYKWTAPKSGHFVLSAFATQIDTIAAVYTGTSVSALTTVGYNEDSADNNSDALVPFDATAGTTYYFSVDHTSADQSPGGDFVLTLNDSAWQFPVGDEVTSSPAVGSDGTIYFGAGSSDSFDPRLYAIRSDGTKKWSYTLTSTGGGIVGASPAIASDGTVYIGGQDKILYALDGATGAKKWSYTSANALFSTPALASDGTIYFRDDTKLYALTTAGSLKWSYPLSGSTTGGTYSSPAVGTDGTIYVGTNGGAFHAVKPDGTQKWVFTASDDPTPSNNDIYTSPAIAADGTLYFATLHGTLYAVTDSGSSATKKWSWTAPTTQSISSSIALGTDGTLYFAGYDHKLHALTSSGTEKWAYELGDEVRASSPAIGADGTIYIGCYDTKAYAINPDGTLQRVFAAAKTIRSSPVVANNRLYFGCADAKLYAFDIGQSAATTVWPMFHQNPARTGRAVTATLSISAQPQSQTVAAGGQISLSVGASAPAGITYQWYKNGAAISGATNATLTLPSVQPADTGLYLASLVSGATSLATDAAIVGVTSTTKVIGAGTELLHDVTHPNGNVYDQVLLTGAAEAITADATQVTRTSFIDVDNDIVQVEFSGPGTLSLVLTGSSGPAVAVNYNQSDVSYMKGHAGIVITGANENTNVSVFTVGRATAYDPTGAFNILQQISATNVPANNGNPLFQGHAATAYDGIADIAFIAISSTNGKFGSVRTANANYFAQQGLTGVYAPGVAFNGPLYLGDLSAFDNATPVIQLGSVAGETRITGGDLFQDNGRAVQVSGLTHLNFTDGMDSHGKLLLAQHNRAVLQQNGQDVTAQIVVNPSP